MKKSIAMKCNKEQFEAIKPKLEGMEIYSVTCFNEFPYLINYDNGIKLSNIDKYTFKNKIIHAEEIHETWNERIFLEACGIEKKEHFEITKETIIKYKMKDEFPEVFKKEEQNGWYKDKEEPLWLGFFENDCLIYGFDTDGDYFNKIHKKGATDSTNDVKATEQEVFEALKNEAVKRGFVMGTYCSHKKPTQDQYKPIKDYFYHERDNCLYGDVENNGGTRIFRKGTWATIIETKTKEEAEKLLNCKIV